MRSFRLLLAVMAAVLPAPTTARPPSLVPADAPELAAPGTAPVGVRTMHCRSHSGRDLEITVFYPASETGPPTHYPHITPDPPAGIPRSLVFEGIASRDSPPATGGRLPLVVLSHGLGRWATAMSGMAENLASKGYVVASIDHDDRGAMDPATRMAAFAAAFVHRSTDQRAAITWLQAFARGTDPLARHIDPGNIAVIGYSMGGFGALATGGAGYSSSGSVLAQLPVATMDSVIEGTGPAAGVRAIVLIAPWGGEAMVRSWTPESLAGMALPSLWIMGDHDDVAGADGILWLHDHTTASDRRLLIFAGARHNLGGNPPPASAPDTPRLRDALDEPVWRKDMADAIIYRTITAFLDLTLRHDAAKAGYIDAAADGSLKGFQNRWQLGLQARHTLAK